MPDLTNPGLVFQDPGVVINPATGQPMVLPPRAQYFPNKQARGKALTEYAGQNLPPFLNSAASEMPISGVEPPAGSASAPTPPIAPPAGMAAPSEYKAPTEFQPSFRQVAGPGPNGMPQGINPAETKLGKLAHILMSAAQGAANGYGQMNAASGAQAARDIPFQHVQRAQEIAKEQAQTQLIQSQSQMVPTPMGMMPPALAKVIYGAAIKAASAKEVQGMKGDTAESIQDKKGDTAESVTGEKIGSQERIAKMREGIPIPVDETVANLAGIPSLAGQSVGKGAWDTINKALTAKGYKAQDLGTEGLWLVDRGGNRIKRIGESPSYGRGMSFNIGRAMYTPFETVDDNGQPTTISNLQALHSGAPGVTKSSLTTVMGKQALIDDIKGGVQQLKSSSKVLDVRGSKLKIAAALAAPGITTQTFLQSRFLESMNSDEQDYTIRLLSLREQAMAMRSVLGAGQGSEDLRDAIQKTVPGAATPGSEYANKQLDQFQTTLERLAKGVPQIKSPANKAKATTASAAPAQTSPATHVFSASAWKKANPQGDVDAATTAAKAQGYEVRP